MTEIFNICEALLWFAIGATLLFKSISVRVKFKWLAIIAGMTFFVFGISDIIEVYTGAWWRPIGLLVLKALCIIVFVVCLLTYIKIKNKK